MTQTINVIKRGGRSEPLDISKIHAVVNYATENLDVSASEIEIQSHISFFDGITTEQIHDSLIQSASEMISAGAYDYTFAAARLLLQKVYKEVNNGDIHYPQLSTYIENGVRQGRLSPDLLTFNLAFLDVHIDPLRDRKFTYMGLKTIADRYLIRSVPKQGQKEGNLIELPQFMWMRVAMGLALNEKPENRNYYAKKFYWLLSTFKFMSSTPTLFNSGTNHTQLASCYLSTVEDSIEGIYTTIKDCAHLSKWAGGLGVDWTRVRPAGDLIKGTNGKSSGILPYLKVFNDTAVAVNQGGKRKGAFAAYLEPWHADVERFLDLKKPAGDEHLRTRELFTALWMNDLFFERVAIGGKWSLFSSKEYPILHQTYGSEFKQIYEALEAEGKAVKTLEAADLWRKIITSLSETGGPWVTFKDESNLRNPQKHVGMVNSSNLCTEITLVTSDDEIAVCNLGSINMAATDVTEFPVVIPLAVRMLDNVIDLNFYPVEKAKRSNMNHRPIGLGMMGWSDYLAMNNIAFDSNEHLAKTFEVFESWSYHAIRASSDLSMEKGSYPSFHGSDWDMGKVPISSARDNVPDFERPELKMDWGKLREQIQVYGMRNSNVMAIAPTATIANITGVTPSIEPPFAIESGKENFSGTFYDVSPLVNYPDAPVKTAFEIDQIWIIKAAAVRQMFIDQSQSVNLFSKRGTRGRELSEWYFLAWALGLKTTYYLKKQKDSEINHSDMSMTGASAAPIQPEPAFCSIDNPDCESCQ